jgi:chloramphenicol-sensitive protein RarD
MNTHRSDAAVEDRSIAVGTAAAVGAFLLFGFFPLYWAQLAHVPALEVIWHRILWGGALAWVVVIVRARWSRSGRRHADSHPDGGGDRLLPRGRLLYILLGNGILLSANWFIYVWAVSSGRTLEASLGYYINPLVSVLFGMLFFTERLRPLQWVAVGSATVGVGYMTLRFGTLPWVSLALAGSFGLYGVVKKRTTLSSIHSLAVELTLVMVLAAVMVLRGIVTGNGAFFAGSPTTTLLLLGASVVTVLPLLLFGIATQRIRLADVGFLQYLAPTLMFIIAIAVFHDPLERGRLIGFIFVWFGLAIYSYSSVSHRRAMRY